MRLSSRRGRNESYRTYELRFDAQLSKFILLGNSAASSNAMATLFLLANANFDSAQRISILYSAAPLRHGLLPRSSLDNFVRPVKKEAIAAVLRQYDQSITTDKENRTNAPQSHSLSAASVYAPEYNRRSLRKLPTAWKMSPNKILHAKNTRSCSKCGMFGPLYNDHNADGSLSAQTVMFNEPIRSNTRGTNVAPADEIPLALKTAKVLFAASVESRISSKRNIGPLHENGAPYFALG